MNRQQKREYERKINKLSNWLSSLTPEQERAINAVIDERVSKTTYSIRQALDTSIVAALNMKTDLSISEIEKILDLASDYMKDSQQFLLKYGEDWIMKINEIKPQIKEECLKILDKGIAAHNDALNELKKVFPNVPKKDLVNTFKEVKEEYQENDEAIKEIVDEIANEITTQNQPISEQKEATNAITPKEENKSVEKQIDKQKQGLKLKYPIYLEGEKGEYIVNQNFIQAGEHKFTSLQDIEKYRIKQLEEFNKHLDEIKEAFSYM